MADWRAARVQGLGLGLGLGLGWGGGYITFRARPKVTGPHAPRTTEDCNSSDDRYVLPAVEDRTHGGGD